MLGLIKYLMMLSGYQVNKKKTPKRTMSHNLYRIIFKKHGKV
jgi:hypothetical protein